jgi:flagellin
VGLRITTNLLSLATQRSLATTTRALARSLQRLASGNRINTGRDDPAGLAMASGLESQRRGLLQAVRNINDARGFLNTADGALAEQTNMVQRMRELAVQASNGTLSDTSRTQLNQEFQSLYGEFLRVTNQTQFNGVNLLDGSFGTKNIQVGSQKGHTISMNLNSMMSSVVFPTGQPGSTTTTTSSVGSGTFKARTTLRTGGSPGGPSAGDLNGDGFIDIVESEFSDDTLSIFLGNGNGTFKPRTTIATVGYPSQSMLLDLNGDGKLDFLGSAHGSTVLISMLGNGNGTFKTAVTANNSGDAWLSVGDLNGDSKLDVVNVYDGGSIYVHTGNGNGTFTDGIQYTMGAHPWGSALADLNGDGKLDVITSDGTGTTTMSIRYGNGNGTFGARSTLLVGSKPFEVLARDFNGDGKIDLISNDASSNQISIYMGNGNGTFTARTTKSTGTYPQGLAGQDLNGDGFLDVITTDENSSVISLFFGNGNGTFTNRTTLSASSSCDEIIFSDVNGDSVPDMILNDFSSGDNTISIYLANSSTVTTTTTSSSTQISFDISSQSHAQDILAVLDTGLAYINSCRSNIGALQSRLDFASSVNENTIENVSAARSQIMDTDMAAETAEFARLQILQKAGIAVLGQANFATQLSLKLLETLQS